MKKETEKAKSLEDQVSILESDLQAELADFLNPRKIRDLKAQLISSKYDLYLEQGISDVVINQKISFVDKLLNKKIDFASFAAMSSRVPEDSLVSKVREIKILLDGLIIKDLSGTEHILMPDNEGFVSISEQLSTALSVFSYEYRLKFRKLPIKVSKAIYNEDQMD